MATGTVVITGDRGKLGRCVVDRVQSARGWRVVGLSRRSRCDVRDYAQVKGAVGSALDGDRANALVACAGICRVSPIEEMRPETFMEVMAVNVTGTYNAVKACLDYGLERVVTIGSLLGSFPMGYPDRSAYIASKAAVAGLTRALAVELAPRGVSVNCVAPAHFSLMAAKGSGLLEGALDKSPMGLITPEEVADVIEWLVCDAPPRLTGQVIVVDGAYTLNQFPVRDWWLDR